MPDLRTRRQKLEAMAGQAVSPREAEVARAMLRNLESSAARIETQRVLSREDVEAAPSRQRSRIVVHYQTKEGTWVHLDVDDLLEDFVRDVDEALITKFLRQHAKAQRVTFTDQS